MGKGAWRVGFSVCFLLCFFFFLFGYLSLLVGLDIFWLFACFCFLLGSLLGS